MRLRSDGTLQLSPSDLSAHLACPHLTTLALEVARGERARSHGREELAELIAAKGDAHERACLEELRREGRQIVEIELPQAPGAFETADEATVDAMRRGVEVIYQATFVRAEWCGRADFVVRVDEPSALGAWSYEPYDAKLARSSRPAAVLQLAWYANAIAGVQGRMPERLHVVLGTGETETFRPDDVAAYLRRAQARLRAQVEERPETYPWPGRRSGQACRRTR